MLVPFFHPLYFFSFLPSFFLKKKKKRIKEEKAKKFMRRKEDSIPFTRVYLVALGSAIQIKDTALCNSPYPVVPQQPAFPIWKPFSRRFFLRTRTQRNRSCMRDRENDSGLWTHFKFIKLPPSSLTVSPSFYL